LELARLHARLGSTMIYVTHDQTEAMTLADRIVVFNGGRVEQVGRPMQLYEQPANAFVARFIGAPAMNLLPGSLYPTLAPRLAGSSRQSPPAAGVASIGVRPENITLASPDEAILKGRVEIVEHLGAETIYYVTISADLPTVTVRTNVGSAPARGTEVGLTFVFDHLHLFDEQGRNMRLAS
jgi:ABC-type sugar transport system ATPase subunit